MLVNLILEKIMNLITKFSFLLVVGCNKCEYHVTRVIEKFVVSKQITNDNGSESVVNSDDYYIIVFMLLLVAEYCLMVICHTHYKQKLRFMNTTNTLMVV